LVFDGQRCILAGSDEDLWSSLWVYEEFRGTHEVLQYPLQDSGRERFFSSSELPLSQSTSWRCIAALATV
jgi:hypothetical protein